MADEQQPEQEERRGPLAIRLPGLSWPGMRKGVRKPPLFDGTKSRIMYRPCFRVVEWYGMPTDVDAHKCGNPPHCSVPGGMGHHSEVRPDGLDWAGVHFSCLEEALANQSFRQWYDQEGGQAIVDKGKMVLYPPYYDKDGEPPLPPYNFFLDEHIHEMSVQEVRAYQRTGFVPKRLRRRGRSRPGAPKES